jgi:RimJ/RimL family protein N-acetyltransferase
VITSDEFAIDPCRGDKDMVFTFCDSDDWLDQFPVIFGERQPFAVMRTRFEFQQLPSDWREQLPDGFSIRRIDKALLENKQLKNIEGVHHWLDLYWGSPIGAFLDYGAGVCVMDGDDTIAAWCLTVNVTGECAELGIETALEYRRRGLGALAARAAVDACLQQGLTTIDWHCSSDHMGSRGVAQSAGFVRERDYPGYIYFLNPVNHVAVPGDILLRGKKYQDALDRYQKAMIMGDAPNWVYHNAAMCCAMLGVKAAALGYLAKSIRRGWQNIALTETCDEFQGLHELPEWSKLVARMKKENDDA